MQNQDPVVAEKAPPSADVGIVVGRFQIHALHDAHKGLIDFVRSRHDRVIIFLGLSPVRGTISNPLDFRARAAMLREVYSDVEVLYIEDCKYDSDWSKKLDSQIVRQLNPHQGAMLYGSRDSFISHYTGRYKTTELESKTFVSGTEVRRQVSNGYKPTCDYRAGVIAGAFQRFPTAFQTVDIAVVNSHTKEILLVRKPEDRKWRFIGGFSDPKSPSLEADARREVHEETGVEVGDPKYVGSTRIDDWRYRGGPDCIKTAIFLAEYTFGRPQGADDVAEARWFPIATLSKENIEEGHHPILDIILPLIK